MKLQNLLLRKRLLLALAVGLASGTAAQAACPSIDFENLAANTAVTSQYSGVTFSVLPQSCGNNSQLSTINVSGPSPSTGWDLQQNTNSVSSVNWSNVVTTPTDDGTTRTVIINPPTGNRFYRLLKP